MEAAVQGGAEDWKPSKYPTHLHDHKLSLMVSPICVRHLTFYFCIGNNQFNYRSRDNLIVAGGGWYRASERTRNDAQVHLWNCSWDCLNCKK